MTESESENQINYGDAILAEVTHQRFSTASVHYRIAPEP